jgi:hypothetical protein
MASGGMISRLMMISSGIQGILWSLPQQFGGGYNVGAVNKMDL